MQNYIITYQKPGQMCCRFYMRIFAFSYCILVCVRVCVVSWKCSFLKGNRGSGSAGEGKWEGMGGVEGGETLVRMYFTRKESILNLKRKEITFWELMNECSTVHGLGCGLKKMEKSLSCQDTYHRYTKPWFQSLGLITLILSICRVAKLPNKVACLRQVLLCRSGWLWTL